MKALEYLSINIFPIVMLFIIFINNHGKTEKSKASAYFDRLVLITVLSMMVDTAGNLAAEISAATPDPVLWIFFAAGCSVALLCRIPALRRERQETDRIYQLVCPRSVCGISDRRAACPVGGARALRKRQ